MAALATTTLTSTGPLFHCADGFLSWFLAWLVNNSTAKLATQSEDIVCMRRRCRGGVEKMQRRCRGGAEEAETRLDEMNSLTIVDCGKQTPQRLRLRWGSACGCVSCWGLWERPRHLSDVRVYMDVYNPRQYVCIYYVHKYFACVFLEFN